MKLFMDAWRDNRNTIGGKRPASARHIAIIYLVEGLLAAFLVFLTPSSSPDFLVGSITAFAIIAGFSFSSLLFMVDHDFSVVVDRESLEQAAQQRRITALSDQLFMNIHYFNLCALLVIVGCLLGLSMPLAERAFGSLADDSVVPLFSESIGRWALFAIGIESFATFLRILARIRYLFGKVREAHQKKLASQG